MYLVIGFGCALLVHVGIFYGEDWFGAAQTPVRRMAQAEPVILMEMPPLEPDKPEEVTPLEEAPASALAPPSLADLPRVVPLDAFTQPIEPPRPAGLEVGRNLSSIPLGRPGSSFGNGLGDLFDLSNLDQAPVARMKVLPIYPEAMKRLSNRGEVVVEFIVDYCGNAVSVQVVRSSDAAFETPAVQAVGQWKFKPGRKGGRDVNTRVQQVIAFNLENY
jgi:protein TonB